jgi:hypothetical protein
MATEPRPNLGLLPIALADIAARTVAAAPVVVRVSTDLSTWEKVAAVGGIVAGVGAAVSAFFSWRTARRSETIARDARDALAASLKPHVVLDFAPAHETIGLAARVLVVGPLMQGGSAAFPASDVRLEFNLQSGKHGSTSIALLNPNQELKLPIEDSGAEWPPSAGEHVTATVSTQTCVAQRRIGSQRDTTFTARITRRTPLRARCPFGTPRRCPRHESHREPLRWAGRRAERLGRFPRPARSCRSRDLGGLCLPPSPPPLPATPGSPPPEAG